jgi:hypothetical protein
MRRRLSAAPDLREHVNNPTRSTARAPASAATSTSEPLQDDDAITFRIAGNKHNPVRHLLGLKS